MALLTVTTHAWKMARVRLNFLSADWLYGGGDTSKVTSLTVQCPDSPRNGKSADGFTKGWSDAWWRKEKRIFEDTFVSAPFHSVKIDGINQQHVIQLATPFSFSRESGHAGHVFTGREAPVRQCQLDKIRNKASPRLRTCLRPACLLKYFIIIHIPPSSWIVDK